MRRLLLTLAMLLAVSACVAQTPNQSGATAQQNPFSAFNKAAYARLKEILLHSAEKMPEENYSFKPTDSVRSYGQIVGHLADAQYLFCSKALVEQNPAPKVEQTKTSKADLIAALKEGFAYCDKAYDTMTDASGAETVKLFGGADTPKLDVLTVNNMHNMEHYGNLVTYMRIKNIVPPTSEQPPQMQPKPDTKK
ncbi:MAG TPA: DinB family protein [Candidatus Sulfotelmatobacter sp.]|nr:DinB family protein [Candidatus Sulfotelmatobacter sp.]